MQSSNDQYIDAMTYLESEPDRAKAILRRIRHYLVLASDMELADKPLLEAALEEIEPISLNE